MIIKNQVLYSDNDKILTNNIIYGKIIYLSENDNVNNYYEIPYDEYQKIVSEIKPSIY